MRGPFRISRVARSAVPWGGDRPNEARHSSDAMWLKGIKKKGVEGGKGRKEREKKGEVISLKHRVQSYNSSIYNTELVIHPVCHGQSW